MRGHDSRNRFPLGSRGGVRAADVGNPEVSRKIHECIPMISAQRPL